MPSGERLAGNVGEDELVLALVACTVRIVLLAHGEDRSRRVDRATMSVARLVDKLIAYARYHRINRAHYWRSTYDPRFPNC